MMHSFLANNRSELIARCTAKAALRSPGRATEQQLLRGVPLFLDQLIVTLELERASRPSEAERLSGPSGGGPPSFFEMGEAAAQHGRRLLTLGFSIDQVVHGYGDLCQAITDLAFERDAPFRVDEFRTLNRCLDNAISKAVTEYAYQQGSTSEQGHSAAIIERLGFLAHEVRNYTWTAKLAFDAIRSGSLSLGGATAAVLERSLTGLETVIKHTLAEVEGKDAASAPVEAFALGPFIEEVSVAARLDAQDRGVSLVVSDVDPELALEANRELLVGAVGNLLQNAFKFTRPHTEILLDAYASGDRILIDIADNCGGLAPGVQDKMFLPFVTTHHNQQGLGLGLSIAKRSVEANQGQLTMRDVPGKGCIFTINLPRYARVEAHREA